MNSLIQCPNCGTQFPANEKCCPQCWCTSKIIPGTNIYDSNYHSFEKIVIEQYTDINQIIETAQRFYTSNIDELSQKLQTLPCVIFDAIPRYGIIDADYIALQFQKAGGTVHAEMDEQATQAKFYGDRSKIQKQIKQSEEPIILTCPTCGHYHVRKISYTERGIMAGLFGLISKTARSQFECQDCGYKW